MIARASRLSQVFQNFAARSPATIVGLAVFLYASSAVVVRGTDLTANVFAFWRIWLGALIFGIVLLWRRSRGHAFLPVSGRKYLVMGGVMFGVNHLFYVAAIKATSVNDVTLINRLSPIVVGVLAVKFFGEKPGFRFFLGAVVGIAGSAMVVLGGASAAGGDLWGMFAAVMTMLTYTLFFLISKRARDYMDATAFLSGALIVAAGAVSLFAAVQTVPVFDVAPRALLPVVFVALVPGGLGHVAMTWPLKWVPANLPPVLMLGLPILSGGLAWIFLGEAATPVQLVGGVITLVGAGMAIMSRAGRQMVASREPLKVTS
ncbi:EamA-like transporter family protein [bacterium BMS3Bbin02]|nr:EamA-like transporter family protein [bacterium BMS3Bbin02]